MKFYLKFHFWKTFLVYYLWIYLKIYWKIAISLLLEKVKKKKKMPWLTRPLEKKELKASNIGLHPGDLLLEKMVMFY